MRDALPNRGLYISEQDLRIADLQEKGSSKKKIGSLSFTLDGLKEFVTSLNLRKSSTQCESGFLKAEVKDEKHRPHSPSFSFFSGNIKDLSGKEKSAESVAAGTSDTVDATNNIASFLELPKRRLVSSPIVRRRSSALSPVPKLQNESYEETSMKFPLPKIYVTPSQSDTEDVPVTSCMQGDEECQTIVDFISKNSVSRVDSGDEKRNNTPDEEFRNKRLLELEACENMEKHNGQHSTEKQEEVSKGSDIQEVKAEEPFEDFCEISDQKKGIQEMKLSNRKEDSIDMVGQRRSTADDQRDVETSVQAEMFIFNEARNSGSKGSFQANHITYYAVSP